MKGLRIGAAAIGWFFVFAFGARAALDLWDATNSKYVGWQIDGSTGAALVKNVAGTASMGAVTIGTTASDGSTTISSGGTAQQLFSGATPTNGWAVYNPDASEDCWVSDSTTAAANNTGSIRLAANGGGYETPLGYKPFSAVSVVCATTAHKLTARKW